MNEGNISVYQIAKQQNITPRWCRKLYKKLSNTPLYRIKIKRPGRKPKEIPINEINKVKEMKQMYGFGAVNLECVLDNIGMHIPHNKIHRILKECNLANNEPYALVCIFSRFNQCYILFFVFLSCTFIYFCNSS